jgi:peptidoglycan/xylan/chitin deacetylase (PgdA/CDA1 family)
MRVTRVVKDAFTDWLSMKKAELRYNSRHWTVLCLHEVTDRDAFKTLLSRLEDKYQIVSLSDGFRAIKTPSVGGPLLTLTFDDGDKTVWQNCLPELQSRLMAACFFVCTGFVEAGFRHVSTGRYQIVSWDDLRDWTTAGLEIGAHTVNHIPLNQATFERSKWEILESKRVLEERLGCPVRHFAYPWGYYTDELDEWLQGIDAFDTISTTIPGDNYPNVRGKHIYRKPAPSIDGNMGKGLRNPTLYETVRAAHQRSILNGLAPVVWRTDQEKAPR